MPDQSHVTDEPARWRHKARGTTYTEVGRGAMQHSGTSGAGCHHSCLDMLSVVIYRSDTDGSLWVRLQAEFEDGRFERLS